MDGRKSGTPGGAKLRALREAAGRSQLWIEVEAELGTGYLQRLEAGRVAQPERPTLARILTALDARYSERREAFALFGYTVATPPPTEADRAWARDIARRELHAVTFPAYVLDCTHRLIAWNGYLPRLLGSAPDAALPGRLADRSFLGAWFDPAAPLAPLVAEPERFLPALIRAMRYEMQAFGGEPWYAAILAELQALPRFRHHWAIVEQQPPPASAARALTPVRLLIPGGDRLQFQLSSETFIRDARFRAIYLFPADPDTMRWCAARTAPPGAAP